jgi:TPR repeat protein
MPFHEDTTMLWSMRILLLSSLALSAPILANAAQGGDGDTPGLADQDQAQRQAKAKALALATEACDKGAAVPLDPNAKAPPVQYNELLPYDFGSRQLEVLRSACQIAWAGAPKSRRLQLQWLRVMVAIGKPDQQWLLLSQLKMLAADGSAEANYLLFCMFAHHHHRNDGASFPVSRQEALRHLQIAAEQGHLQALSDLLWQYRSGTFRRRDSHEAVRIARRIESAPPQGKTETEHEARMRADMALVIATITLDDDSFPKPEQRIAFDVVDKDYTSATDNPDSVLAYIKALRFGRGTAKDQMKARQMLEARLDKFRDENAKPMLADMLAKGEGGPADPKRGLSMLRDENVGTLRGAPAILAGLLLDGKAVGRQPREAIRVLAKSWELADQILLAGLLMDYKTSLDDPKRLVKQLFAAAEVSEPGAAVTLAKLKLSSTSEFNDVDGARALLKPLVDAGDREALWLYASSQYTNLDSSSSQSDLRAGGLSEDDLKRLIDEGMAKKELQAFLLRAVLLRKGVLYPQDDQAATSMLISAADLGNVEAMVLLGHAYDEGLGIPGNPRERLRVWREAAKRGSIAAQQNLANSFPFDRPDRQMTLEEGVTSALVLFINGVDRLPYGVFTGKSDTDIRIGRIFRPGSRAMEDGVPAVTDAVMDAFRAAPAGLEERMLVEMGKAFPDEIRIAIERKLKDDGFYSGQPEGYFGPEVRKALAAWVDAKGPVTETAVVEAKQDQAPKARKDELIDPDMLARVRDRAFRDGIAAKSDRQRLTALSALNALAQYGDMAPRWALVRNYHQARVVRKIVSPAEITRYALDVLVTKPESAEKADFEFIFDVSQIYKDGEIYAFGDAMLTAIRDDERLQDPLTLGGILQHLTFAPAACDAVLSAAKKARVKDLGQEGCDETTMSALVAFARARGPAGVDAKARKAAVVEIKAMDAEAKR